MIRTSFTQNPLIILLLIFSANCYSQVENVVWSKPIPFKGIQYTLGEFDGSIYVAYENRNIWVKKFNSETLDQIPMKSIRFPAKPKGISDWLKNLGRFTIGNKMILISFGYSKHDKSYKVFGTVINSNGEVEKVWFELTSIKVKTDSEDVIPFIASNSADSSRILIVTTIADENGDSIKRKVLLVDENLNEIWRRDIPFPYESASFINVLLDKNENIHMNIATNPSFERKRQYLLSYYPKTEKTEEFQMTLDSQSIFFSSMRMDVSNNIVIIGFYTQEDANRLKGYFHVRKDFNSTLQPKMVVKPFSDIVLSTFNQLQYMVSRPDGSMVVFMEPMMARWMSVSTPTGIDSYLSHEYFDVLNIHAICVDSSGKLKWEKEIPRLSELGIGKKPSFGILLTDKNIHLIFNDSESNYDKEGKRIANEYLKDRSKSVLVDEIIDSDGNTTTSFIPVDKRGGVYPWANHSWITALDANNFIILLSSINKQKTGKVTCR